MKFKYFMLKFSCFALSVVMTVSVVLFLFGVSNVFMFQNRGLVDSSIVNQKQAFIEQIGETYDDMQDSFSVPSGALKLALEKDAIDIIAGIVSNNFTYGYSTDFTDSEPLYNCYASAIGQYCRENSIDITDEDISINASLAITVLNKELGGSATSNVSIFSLSKNRIIAIMIGASAVLFVAAFFLLDFINYGRHRKYSYIGMGIITSGYIMILAPMFVKYKGFVKMFDFCGVDLYNKAISSLYSKIFDIFIIVGALLLVVGAIILIINYRYFKKKGERVKAARESSEQMKNEYMQQYNAKKATRANKSYSGRTVMTIDFEDEE